MALTPLRAYAHAMIHTAVIWDLLGTAGIFPPWWPPVGYVLAALGIAAACLSALLAMLTERWIARAATPAAPRGPSDGAAVAPPPARTRAVGAQLFATGILLIAWLLRGHAEIPPDPPLVAAEVLAAALYAVFSRRGRTRTRDAR